MTLIPVETPEDFSLAEQFVIPHEETCASLASLVRRKTDKLIFLKNGKAIAGILNLDSTIYHCIPDTNLIDKIALLENLPYLLKKPVRCISGEEKATSFLIEIFNSVNGGFDTAAPTQPPKIIYSYKMMRWLSAKSQVVSIRPSDYSTTGGPVKIADIGAGTGRYSIELCHRGYDVTAVELVKHNLEILRAKHENIKTWQGDARSLPFLEDETFDVTLLFGPLYHLHGDEEKLKALKESKRITKKGGIILVAYVMNEYSVIMYGFHGHHMKQAVESGMIDQEFHCTDLANDLYNYSRLEDIYALSDYAGLTRERILSQDGPANHMRRVLNAMDEDEFQLFIQYQLSVCERPELLGAGCHTLDILRK